MRSLVVCSIIRFDLIWTWVLTHCGKTWLLNTKFIIAVIRLKLQQNLKKLNISFLLRLNRRLPKIRAIYIADYTFLDYVSPYISNVSRIGKINIVEVFQWTFRKNEAYMVTAISLSASSVAMTSHLSIDYKLNTLAVYVEYKTIQGFPKHH